MFDTKEGAWEETEPALNIKEVLLPLKSMEMYSSW